MECERCGGLVTWRGPFSALTHTECEQCGCINCQVPEQTQDEDEDDDPWLAGDDPMGASG